MMAFGGRQSETDAEFEDERFQLSQNGRLQIPLLIGAHYQPEKIEEIGIAEDQIVREFIFLTQRSMWRGITLPGFLEIAVRSKSIEAIFAGACVCSTPRGGTSRRRSRV